jgi:dTDP-L-rhamnose 4-epimerase
MAKILITGGAGFIGSNLALRLLDRGHSVRVLDTLSPQIHGTNPESSPLFMSIRDKVDFIQGDVTSEADLRKALDGQTHVVHFAAETGTGQSMYQIEKYMRVNVGGTALLLDLLANEKHAVSRVVVASSRSIYGEGKYLSPTLGAVYPCHRTAEDMSVGDFAVKYEGSADIEPVATDEESKIHPSSVYGISKQGQEQLVMTVCPSIGIEGVALRYQNVFGPGQSLSNPYTGILSIFSNLIMHGKPINVFEDGEESRDFVFIDDVVSSTVLALENPSAAGEVFNVGTGVPTDVMTVARLLMDKLGGNSDIKISGNFRAGDIRHNYASLEKAEKLLGFTPTVSFEQGLDKFCAWVRTMEPVESKYDASLKEMKERGLLK